MLKVQRARHKHAHGLNKKEKLEQGSSVSLFLQNFWYIGLSGTYSNLPVLFKIKFLITSGTISRRMEGDPPHAFLKNL